MTKWVVLQHLSWTLAVLVYLPQYLLLFHLTFTVCILPLIRDVQFLKSAVFCLFCLAWWRYCNTILVNHSLIGEVVEHWELIEFILIILHRLAQAWIKVFHLPLKLCWSVGFDFWYEWHCVLLSLCFPFTLLLKSHEVFRILWTKLFCKWWASCAWNLLVLTFCAFGRGEDFAYVAVETNDT